MFTPGPSSSPSSRVKTFTSTMMPLSPWGTFREVSRTSLAFSPKMARSRRSSAVRSVSPLGVTLPTRMSPAWTSAPTRIMPRSSRSFRASSPTLGMSRVISSGPSLVSRASVSYSSMWMEVKTSSLHHSLIEQDGVLVVVALPGHKAHEDVLAQGDLALVGGGAVRNDIAPFSPGPRS